jgi:hypothetical protein
VIIVVIVIVVLIVVAVVVIIVILIVVVIVVSQYLQRFTCISVATGFNCIFIIIRKITKITRKLLRFRFCLMF